MTTEKTFQSEIERATEKEPPKKLLREAGKATPRATERETEKCTDFIRYSWSFFVTLFVCVNTAAKV